MYVYDSGKAVTVHGSAQPPAKKSAGLIEKETDEVLYKQIKNFK
jgi:hypothetical protein